MASNDESIGRKRKIGTWDQPLSQVALHNNFRLAIERIAAHFVIGHDGDEAWTRWTYYFGRG
jgi:hypothetical protein